VEAVKLVRSGDVVMIGGFGNVGNPKRLIDLLADTDIYDLHRKKLQSLMD